VAVPVVVKFDVEVVDTASTTGVVTEPEATGSVVAVIAEEIVEVTVVVNAEIELPEDTVVTKVSVTS
jgi:hypothetical protein